MKRAIIWAAVSTQAQADEDERFSIPKQIADGTALCERNGWQIIDTLIVPGHSRSYRTLAELAEDARKEGIDAFDRLIAHFERRDFDIFICRDANRFARKPSLLHYIVETIIEDCRANIYSQNDNFFVTEENMDMWATMQGYRVRAEVRNLVKFARAGLIKRAERGLTTTRIPWSHRLVRDDKLRPSHIEVDESKRRLFDDLYRLIVEERTPYNGIEKILFERFGHVGEDGVPYGDNMMYGFLFHPLTWGITTYGLNSRARSRTFSEWVFDESIDPPEGVEVVRNALPPVYTGEQAERLKAELRRRKQMIGNRRPKTPSAFSGLFICGQCKHTLTVRTNDYNRPERVAYALRCNADKNSFQFRVECEQSVNVAISYIKNYIDVLLRRLVETQDVSEILPSYQDVDQEIRRLKDDENNALRSIEKLITLQMNAHAAAEEAYQRRIDSIATQIEATRSRLRELQSHARRYQSEIVAAQAALKSIQTVIDRLWELPEAEINQYLHQLMGNRRFVVLDGKIVGIVRHTRTWQRRKPRKG